MKPQFWHAPKMWLGSTVFLIGGGTSLRDMDWSLLHGRRTIGCNDAYLLGPRVTDICYFGDRGWYRRHTRPTVDIGMGPQPGLLQFSGLKVTCLSEMVGYKGLLVLQRRPRTIEEAPRVGWFTSTGASAINLAAILGAKKIVLLGYDMTLGPDKMNNWHLNLVHNPNQGIFKKFIEMMGHLKKDMELKHPDVEILNANPESRLELFPKIEREELLR